MYLYEVIVSKLYDYEASCQLPVLLYETYTFILNILSKKLIEKFRDR